MRPRPAAFALHPPDAAFRDPQARPAQAHFPDPATGARLAEEAARHLSPPPTPPPGTLAQLLDVRDEGLVPGPLRLSQGGRSLQFGCHEPSPRPGTLARGICGRFRPRRSAQDGPGG